MSDFPANAAASEEIEQVAPVAQGINLIGVNATLVGCQAGGRAVGFAVAAYELRISVGRMASARRGLSASTGQFVLATAHQRKPARRKALLAASARTSRRAQESIGYVCRGGAGDRGSNGATAVAGADPGGGHGMTVPPIVEIRRLAETVQRTTELEPQLAHLATKLPGCLHITRREPMGRASIAYASAGLSEIFGVAPKDAVRDVSCLFERIHPDDRAPFLAEVDASARGTRPFRAEYRVLHPEKGERWIESHSELQTESGGGCTWFGFSHDISGRKGYEVDVLRRLDLEGRLARLTENVPGVLFTVRRGRTGILSMPWVSSKLVEVTGVWPDEVQEDLAAFALAIDDRDSASWHVEGARSAATQRLWRSEFRLNHPLRGQIWLEWLAAPQRDADGSMLWHGFLHDVTPRKTSEEDQRMGHHCLRHPLARAISGWPGSGSSTLLAIASRPATLPTTPLRWSSKNDMPNGVEVSGKPGSIHDGLACVSPDGNRTARGLLMT